jgi:hypothetical protein
MNCLRPSTTYCLASTTEYACIELAVITCEECVYPSNCYAQLLTCCRDVHRRYKGCKAELYPIVIKFALDGPVCKLALGPLVLALPPLGIQPDSIVLHNETRTLFSMQPIYAELDLEELKATWKAGKGLVC